MNDANILAVEGQSSALTSDTLLSNKEKIEGGADVDKEKDIKRIQFSGGGNTF